MGLGCGSGERPLEVDLCEGHWIAAVGNRCAYAGGIMGNDIHRHHSKGHEQPRTVEGGGGSLGSGPVEEKAPSDRGGETQGWWEMMLNIQRGSK